MESYYDAERQQEVPVPTENPSFKPDNVTLFEQGSDLVDKKRSGSASELPSQSAHAWNFYVSSPAVEHSAIQLCASVTSLGPDFYSEYERKFCDMGLPGSGSRQLYDVCDDTGKLPCWNKDVHQMEGAGGKKKRASKRYTHQVAWKKDGIRSVINLLGNTAVMDTMPTAMTGLSNATITSNTTIG